MFTSSNNVAEIKNPLPLTSQLKTKNLLLAEKPSAPNLTGRVHARSAALQDSASVKLANTSATRAVPGGRTFRYNISASGTTYFGNTSFPSANTQYTPFSNFRLPGTLVVQRRIAAQNSNGVNPRDVGLFIGNDISLITAGTLRYGTHTYMHRYWGGRTTGRPAIDTALVRVNNRANTLTADVDQQWARNDTTNIFSWNTSFTSAPKQILAGRVTIRFKNGGRRVSGSATFAGNGFIEPGAYGYTVTFSGTLAR